MESLELDEKGIILPDPLSSTPSKIDQSFSGCVQTQCYRSEMSEKGWSRHTRSSRQVTSISRTTDCLPLTGNVGTLSHIDTFVFLYFQYGMHLSRVMLNVS